MAEQVVELAPGESELVSFEATPHEAKTYQVSINGLTGSFRTIAKPAAKFYMPSSLTVKVTYPHLTIYWKCMFSCKITNIGDATGTYTLTGRDNADIVPNGGARHFSKQITLAPGKTYTWSTWYFIDFTRFPAPYVWELWGDWEENNYSRGEARR